MFIRTKKIKGNDYAYLVENSWTESGSRQKAKGYLGRVYAIEPQKKESFSEKKEKDYTQKKMFAEIINDLVLFELERHGFERKGDVLILDKKDMSFDVRDMSVKKSGKPAVLKINNGFFCSKTVSNLCAGFGGDVGYQLAERLTNAGIAIDKELFVELVEKLKSDHNITAIKEEFKDFYY
jgi:hypothetical protein